MLTSLGMGGAERLVLALASRMAERGHKVQLLILRPPVPEQWPTALPVVHLGMRRTPFSVLSGLIQARRFLREHRQDLIHSHSFHPNFGWLRMLAYRLTDGLSRQTTAVSQAAADRFVRLKAVPQRKCTVLTNGIDTAEFAPDAGRRATLKAEMDAGENFVWLTAGRIAPPKDYPNLLRAFALVTAARSDTRLWVAGEGNVDEVSGLARLARELGLTGRVRWLGLRRDLPALLDAADAFVLASAWEGMPLALGEAMAMEKPVVATDVGGVRELVADAGMIVPAKDSSALAAAMLRIIQMSAHGRRTLGRAARARIESQFGMDAKVDEWEALYTTVLKRKL